MTLNTVHCPNFGISTASLVFSQPQVERNAEFQPFIASAFREHGAIISP